MKNKILIGAAALMLAAMSVPASETINNNSNVPLDFYRGGELSVDAFGTMSAGRYTIDHLSSARVRHNARLGAGVGLNYFFTRNIGIGGDAYSEDNKGAFIDSASANLIVRFPLGQGGLAPYIYGGGGHQWDMGRVWFAQVGAGLEYRFTPHVGAFVDARWVLPDQAKYYGVARMGLRFAF